MAKKDHVYLTTTLPYVNAKPHIGFALELIQADAVARYWRGQGKKVFLNFGTDEHGLKIYRKAQEEGIEPQAYVDRFAGAFKDLADQLTISRHNFIRTTDAHHKEAAQAFWKRCEEKGDIYKKNYTVKYCVGCELEKTDSELVDGKCPIHPSYEIEHIEEENYFFKFSNYQEELLDLYKNNADFVIPAHRQNEIASFVEGGLQDFSISRRKEKMPWGVPVPTDEEHVMYVWFDALVNYISAIGWPDRVEEFDSWWPVVQFAGKDNLRQQAAMWQAMLLSVGINPSKQIVIHGFITSGGQKMSKSIGNVIDPAQVVAEFGADALRYFVLREMQPFEDSDFTHERFVEAYNANLANGIGNLTSRIMKMATSYLDEKVEVQYFKWPKEYVEAFEAYRLNDVADIVWKKIGELDERIQKEEPFKLVKEDRAKAQEIVKELVQDLYQISYLLHPLLPTASVEIKMAVENHAMPEPLFKRAEE